LSLYHRVMAKDWKCISNSSGDWVVQEHDIGMGGIREKLWRELFFFVVLDLNSKPTPWATPSALFCDRFLLDRVWQTICPSWLWTVIFLLCVCSKDYRHEPPAPGWELTFLTKSHIPSITH
jgi:hypothetical protein